MNRILAYCMLGSVAVGGGAAALAVASGGGLLLGLLAYSLVGSGTLVGSTVLLQPGRGRSGVPAAEPKPDVDKTAEKAALVVG